MGDLMRGGVQAGQVHRIDGDGDPAEEWKAWLWPVPGQRPGLGVHCDAVTRKGPLEALLTAAGRRWPATSAAAGKGRGGNLRLPPSDKGEAI